MLTHFINIGRKYYLVSERCIKNIGNIMLKILKKYVGPIIILIKYVLATIWVKMFLVKFLKINLNVVLEFFLNNFIIP